MRTFRHFIYLCVFIVGFICFLNPAFPAEKPSPEQPSAESKKLKVPVENTPAYAVWREMLSALEKRDEKALLACFSKEARKLLENSIASGTNVFTGISRLKELSPKTYFENAGTAKLGLLLEAPHKEYMWVSLIEEKGSWKINEFIPAASINVVRALITSSEKDPAKLDSALFTLRKRLDAYMKGSFRLISSENRIILEMVDTLLGEVVAKTLTRPGVFRVSRVISQGKQADLKAGPDQEILPARMQKDTFYLVSRNSILSNQDIELSKFQFSSLHLPIVEITLKNKGKQKLIDELSRFSEPANYAVIVDNHVYSTFDPHPASKSGKFWIEGLMIVEHGKLLSALLSTEPLSTELEVVSIEGEE